MFVWLGRLLFGTLERYPQTNPFGIRGVVERVRADIPAWIVSSERGSRTVLMVEARWAFWALSPPARKWRSAYWHDPYSGLSLLLLRWLNCLPYRLMGLHLALREAIPIDLRDAYSVLAAGLLGTICSMFPHPAAMSGSPTGCLTALAAGQPLIRPLVD